MVKHVKGIMVNSKGFIFIGSTTEKPKMLIFMKGNTIVKISRKPICQSILGQHYVVQSSDTSKVKTKGGRIIHRMGGRFTFIDNPNQLHNITF